MNGAWWHPDGTLGFLILTVPVVACAIALYAGWYRRRNDRIHRALEDDHSQLVADAGGGFRRTERPRLGVTRSELDEHRVRMRLHPRSGNVNPLGAVDVTWLDERQDDAA